MKSSSGGLLYAALMRLLAAIAALSLLLAGCGDDDTAVGATSDETTEGATSDETTEGATSDDAEGFNLQLTDTAEVPGPGEEEGSGTADVILGDGEACVEVTVVLAAAPQAMHIHEATVAQAGPVVVDFGQTTTEDGWSVCVEADQALLDEIAADPAGYYLNVHNADFPDGAVRAQLG